MTDHRGICPRCNLNPGRLASGHRNLCEACNEERERVTEYWENDKARSLFAHQGADDTGVEDDE